MGMRFVNVNHDMLNGPDGNKYLCASCSFIHDFYLNNVALKMKLNNKTHNSEYNAEILENSLKADYNCDYTNNERTVISDTINASTNVTGYFSEDTEQVNSEMHHLNSAMKYGFVMLENTRSTIAVDKNGLRIKLSNSKWKCVSEIITPGGAFTKGK